MYSNRILRGAQQLKAHGDEQVGLAGDGVCAVGRPGEAGPREAPRKTTMLKQGGGGHCLHPHIARARCLLARLVEEIDRGLRARAGGGVAPAGQTQRLDSTQRLLQGVEQPLGHLKSRTQLGATPSMEQCPVLSDCGSPSSRHM